MGSSSVGDQRPNTDHIPAPDTPDAHLIKDSQHLLLIPIRSLEEVT